MLVLENGDKIQGDATNATEVDFTIHGLDNNALKQLADGQLASSKGDLYTADSTDVVTAITLTNTGAAHNHINLYLLPSGGAARRLIAKDLLLESGYTLLFEGGKVVVLSNLGKTITSGEAGSHGTSGTSGTSGDSGSSGSSGTAGSSGSSGSSGTHGTSGTSGTSGNTGSSGSSGTSGTAEGGGKLVQVQQAVLGTVASGSTTMPEDNTIPQKTEGWQVITCSITPKSASHILFVFASIQTGYQSADVTTYLLAMFRDDGANAVAAANLFRSTYAGQAHLTYMVVAGSVAATTFKIRLGGVGEGTTYVNTHSTASTQFGGGVSATTLTIFEIAP